MYWPRNYFCDNSFFWTTWFKEEEEYDKSLSLDLLHIQLEDEKAEAINEIKEKSRPTVFMFFQSLQLKDEKAKVIIEIKEECRRTVEMFQSLVQACHSNCSPKALNIKDIHKKLSFMRALSRDSDNLVGHIGELYTSIESTISLFLKVYEKNLREQLANAYEKVTTVVLSVERESSGCISSCAEVCNECCVLLDRLYLTLGKKSNHKYADLQLEISPITHQVTDASFQKKYREKNFYDIFFTLIPSEILAEYCGSSGQFARLAAQINDTLMPIGDEEERVFFAGDSKRMSKKLEKLQSLSALIDPMVSIDKFLLENTSLFEDLLASIVDEITKTQELIAKRPVLPSRFDNIIIPRAEVEIEKMISRDGFSSVFKSKWRQITVAFKIIRNCNDANSRDTLEREVKNMLMLRHPRVLTLMAVCNDLPPSEGDVGLITEYMERGTLYDILHVPSEDAASIRPTTEAKLLLMCLDVAQGMNYLHRSKIMHRDLKSANVLVDCQGRCKVGDFQLSTTLGMSKATDVLGTPQWTAPEVMNMKLYTYASDVFSFAVICWELVSDNIPWEGIAPTAVLFAVGDRNERLATPEDCSPIMREIITSCFEEPENRPTFDDLCTKLEAAQKVANLKKCVICLSMENRCSGVECASSNDKHFYCKVCFDSVVKYQVSAKKRGSFMRHGSRIVCEICLQTDPPKEITFAERDVYTCCENETQEKYRSTCLNVARDVGMREGMEKMQPRIDAMQQELVELSLEQTLCTQIKATLEELQAKTADCQCPRNGKKSITSEDLVDCLGCWRATDGSLRVSFSVELECRVCISKDDDEFQRYISLEELVNVLLTERGNLEEIGPIFIRDDLQSEDVDPIMSELLRLLNGLQADNAVSLHMPTIQKDKSYDSMRRNRFNYKSVSSFWPTTQGYPNGLCPYVSTALRQHTISKIHLDGSYSTNVSDLLSIIRAIGYSQNLKVLSWRSIDAIGSRQTKTLCDAVERNNSIIEVHLTSNLENKLAKTMLLHRALPNMPKDLSGEDVPGDWGSNYCPLNLVRYLILEHFNLNKEHFDATRDWCFCLKCRTNRGDSASYRRGNPSKKYALPAGFVRLGLRVDPGFAADNHIFEDWHVTYHGTKHATVENIFKGGMMLQKPGDTLLGGHELRIRGGHIPKPFERFNEYTREIEMFDPVAIYTSPSPKYASNRVYADQRVVEWPGNPDHQLGLRIVFQCRQRPDSYKVGQETIRATAVIDPNFDNNELEFYTKENVGVRLTGLLVQVSRVIS